MELDGETWWWLNCGESETQDLWNLWMKFCCASVTPVGITGTNVVQW